MSSGVVLGLGCAAGWGVANFIAGTQSRRLPALSVVLISEVLSTPVMLLVLLSLGERPPPEAILWGAAAGCFGVIGLTAFYAAMGLGMLSVVAPISAVGAAIPVAVALLRGEVPGPVQGAGIAVALLGVVLVSRPPGGSEEALPAEGPGRAEDPAPADARRALALAVAAAAGFGLFFVLADAGTSATARSPLWVIAGARAASLVLLGTAAALRPAGVVWPGRRLPLIAAMGLVDTTASVLFVLATTRGSIAVVSVLASLYPVVTVLLARLWLKERLGGIQAVGASLAIGGVALLGAG